MADPVQVPRVEYPVLPVTGFEVETVPAAPLDLFATWLAEVVAAGLPEPNAAALATADGQGRPSVRLVLVKIIDARGFCFFTNYRSRKGRELEANPAAALSFVWHPVHRQVQVRGSVVRLTTQESQAYFATRPRQAQLGAWASNQSQEVSRADLEERVDQLTTHFGTDPIPMPDHWGGFVLVPEAVEFWAGRHARLHDRIEYRRVSLGGLDDPGAWTRRRLAP